MATILKEKGLWFNDVVLIPQPGQIRSRKDVPRELNRFICSGMTAVVGKTFAKTATDMGLSVCIPRFLGIDKEIEIYNNCTDKTNLYCSMGLKDLKRIVEFNNIGCKNYTIDVASGYLPHLEETIQLLEDNAHVEKIIIGNVVTKKGCENLINFIEKRKWKGIIRLGISNGSGCETYSQTGYGSGALTEIIDCAILTNNNVKLASDGGLKDGGYVSKAFLAGVDYCYIGGMFAKSEEAETHINGDGTYYGLASEKNQILSTGKKFNHTEGKEYSVDKSKIKPLKEIVNDLWGCVSSAVSYSGHKTLTNAIGNGIFQIKENSLPPRIRY